jgi:hypothetical protein
MPTEALTRLRPLGTGQLLDQAIRLYRRNFLKFVAIIAIVQIPLSLLNTVASIMVAQGTMTPEDLVTMQPDFSGLFNTSLITGTAGSCLVLMATLVLVQGVATAALTRAVADHYLGQPVGFVDAYRRIGKSWGSLVGAILLASLFVILLLLWLIVPCIGWFTGPGILVFVSLAVIPLIAPVVVIEGESAGTAMIRAWNLVRRRFWHVVGFAAILLLFNTLVTSGPILLLTLLFGFFSDNLVAATSSSTAVLLETTLNSLFPMISSLLYLPLQLTCMTLFYFDLRVRTEGFDLALLAEEAMGEQEDVAAIAARAPTQGAAGLITWNEVGYFALLTLAAVAFYSVLYVIGMVIGLASVGLGGLPGL